VAGYIDLLWLQRAYERVDLGPSSVIFVLRQAPEGTVLVLRVPPPAGAGTTQMHLELPPLERPGLVRSPIDGVERLVAGWRIDASPLVVGVSRDKDAVLHDWRLEAWRVLVRTLILSALGAAAIAALVRQLRRAEAGERALRDSEERYALAMDSANEGHYDWNMKGGSSFVSVKMLELLGLPRETQFADRDRMLESVSIHPDDMRRINAAYAAHMEGRSACYEVQYRVLHADGQWHWLRTRGQCLRDAEGRPDRFVGSTMEVTGEKRAEAERQRLEAALRKSQKMEAMGTLAGGIAHDFNNILGAILGYGEMAQKDLPQGSALRHYVDNVIAAGERAKALVERILTFSRSGLGARTPVNVQAVAQETLDLLAASLPAGVQLVPRLASGDAAVIGDPTQLHQVLMNLCTNAVHAMDDAGTLEVLLDRVEVREARRCCTGRSSPVPT
jgi:PAS domain S-box-containing protein